MTAAKHTLTGKVDRLSAQVSLGRRQRSERGVIVKMSEDASESTHADTQAAAGWLSENSMLAQLIGPRVTEAEPERYLPSCWRRIRHEGRGRHLVDTRSPRVVICV